jgi:peptidase S24-like protein
MAEQGKLAFARRLNEAFDKIGIPEKHKGRYTAIAKLFTVTPVAAKDWCDGVSYPSVDKLVQILHTVRTSADWLLFGRTLNPEKFLAPPQNELNVDATAVRSRQIVDYIAFDREWLKSFGDAEGVALILVVGDAMEPSLRPDDLVLVDLTERGMHDNGIYVFLLEEDASLIVRRVHRNVDGTLDIRCDNPQYHDQHARVRYKDQRFLTESATMLPLTCIGRVRLAAKPVR